MNLPPSRPSFEAMQHQLGLAVQQEAGRQLSRSETQQAQQASLLLDAYKQSLNRAGGMTERERLFTKLAEDELASQSTDLGEAAMKYAGLA